MGLFSRKKTAVVDNENAGEWSPSSFGSVVKTYEQKRAEIIDAITLKNFTRPPLSATSGVMDFNPSSVLSVSGYGESITNQHIDWFGNHGFIGYQTCAILSQHWLVDLACTVPVEDAVRKGWELSSTDGKELDAATLAKIRKADKKLKIRHKLKNFGIFGRKYGVRVAVFDVKSNDKDYYAMPFNIDGVDKGSYNGIVMNDPYYCIPLLEGDSNNPSSPDFYEPEFWQIGGRKIHKSHCVIFRHSEVPQILKPSYIYGGVSLTQQIFESVYNAEITASEIPRIIQNMRLFVYHMDLQKALANPDLLYEKMGQLGEIRNNHGTQVIGEDEALEQIQTALGGLDELCSGRYKIVASVAQMPVCKIMKTDITGGLVKGGGEEAIYHETLESLQTDLQPFLDRHYQILSKSLFGDDKEIEVVWNKLDAMTEKEQADCNLVKAQVAAAYVASGAIDGTDIRERLSTDHESGFGGLDAMEMPNEVEA